MNTKNLILRVAQLLLGASMVVFGLNKFLGFIAVDPPTDPTAQTFLGTMFGSYLAKLVASTEIAGGILLMLPRTSFVGLLVLLPVMTNIVGFHLAHDMPGNGIWLVPTLLTTVVLYFHIDRFKKLVQS